MESIFMIVLVAFNVWTIYFYNKLLLEVANNKEEEEKPSIDPMALVGKSLFKVSQLRKKEETEDIDTAVKTVKASKATDKEKRHAGKVFHEMDGNQFYEKFMENSKECKKNIHDFVTFYLQGHKIEQTSKPKKEFKVPDSIEDFNILDFV